MLTPTKQLKKPLENSQTRSKMIMRPNKSQLSYLTMSVIWISEITHAKNSMPKLKTSVSQLYLAVY